MIGMLNHSRECVGLTVPAERDANLNPPRPFYSAAELALFGGRDMTASNTTMQPETQVLDQFLSMSDLGLFPNLGIGARIGPAGLYTETPFGQKTTESQFEDTST
jgi:hypothetical protein